MKFDIMRYLLARTIAKNEGASNPNQVAMLPAMLGGSMPVTLLMTQAMARRDVAGKPAAASTAAEVTEVTPSLTVTEMDTLVGRDFQYAEGFITARGLEVNIVYKAASVPNQNPEVVHDVKLTRNGEYKVTVNPAIQMPDSKKSNKNEG